MIKVLREGIHTKKISDQTYTVWDPICSSSILIRTQGVNILVDPGHIARHRELVNLLDKEGLKPYDIDFVFITHHHMDHASDMGAFLKAKLFIEDGFIVPNDVSYEVYKDLEKVPLPGSCKVLLTPGHTIDSRSFLFIEDNVRFVCAGDAVREDAIRGGEKIGYDDEKLFKQSVKFIFKTADIIIPGHGRIIEGKNKEELQKIVEKY
jgi:glyoxylase-like metal-dependent hydrolase (beta-lactamase superfamily II)